MFENRHCTLCGPTAQKQVKYAPSFSEADLTAEVFSARRSPDKRHFRIVECEGCGILYSDPACDPSLLKRLYEESAVNYGTQEAQIYDSYAPVLDRAVSGLKKRGTFLEIGGGRGFMLRYGAEKGFDEQIEIEPSKDAEAKFVPSSTQSRFIQGIFTQGALRSNSVSLACFFQMLDHVPNPALFVKDVFDVLETGGAGVCVTHNTRALSAKLLGERSPIFDVEHTYLFNPENMVKLFQKAGFEKVEAFPISNRYAMRHWLHLAPIPRSLKKIISAIMEATGLAGLRFPIRAGNFAVIGYKPLGSK